MSEEKLNTCSACSCEFSLEDEGGIDGYFGILPMSFCPTCFACMEDMCAQLRMPLHEQLRELSQECATEDEKILIEASVVLERISESWKN